MQQLNAEMEHTALVEITEGHVPTTAESVGGLIETMNDSRNKFVILAIIGVVGMFFYFAKDHSKEEHRGQSKSQSVVDAEGLETNSREFGGYECTVDCSGHEAGYTWAEQHDITDGDDCDTAGEHSNSPSFAEGCHAYVDGESEPEEAADPDNDNE